MKKKWTIIPSRAMHDIPISRSARIAMSVEAGYLYRTQVMAQVAANLQNKKVESGDYVLFLADWHPVKIETSVNHRLGNDR